MSSISGFKPGIYTSGTRPTNPFIGQIIFETDTGKILVYYGTTILWQPMWSEAWGEIGYVEKTTTFVMTDSVNPEDVPGMSLTFASLVGRFYVVDLEFELHHTGGVSSVSGFIEDTGTQLLFASQGSSTPGGSQDTQVPKWLQSNAIAGTGANKTIKFRTTKGAGSGEILASATIKALMVVRDIGPSGAPVITN